MNKFLTKIATFGLGMIMAIGVGVGAVAGAVAIMMMPRSNPARKLAVKAADKVEDVAWKMSAKLTDEFDL